jgi:methylmalonyl-CoA mutase, C-terminal domain
VSEPARVLVTVLGLDQHEAGALAVASLLRDAGVEVVYTGRFNTPATIAAIAVDEDVDVVGVSCHSWEFLYYAAELSCLLHSERPPIPIVVGGSVVTQADRDEVLANGIDAAVLPSAPVAEVIETVLAQAAVRRVARGVADAGASLTPSTTSPNCGSRN